MRKLQVSKRFGTVYDVSSDPGSLAIFCPSCPQPGINLPLDWKELPSWVTRRTITVDGNFHADHIKMRRPDRDIMLTNGQGYMVEDEKYQEYLSVAKEPRLVSRLESYILFPFDLMYFYPETLLPESPSCERRQLQQQKKPRCHRSCRMLLCKTWVLHPEFGLRFAKGRKVGEFFSSLPELN